MRYVIMMIIVIWLAFADFITGVVKAYKIRELNSTKMRHGGLNKISEIIVMTTGCGLEAGIKALGKYYDQKDLAASLAGITGTAIAALVFGYIVSMEALSILENYSIINPRSAGWIEKLKKRFKIFNDKEDKK